MAKWSYVDREGTRVALADFGGSGSPFILLHGLAGHAEEWADTASWLCADHRVFGLDLRGHGRSEPRPDDVSLAALVADVVHVIDHVGAPVILGGQSLGGLLSIVAAAQDPDLVQALVIAEASPSGMEEQEAAGLAVEVRDKLQGWPVPFRSRSEATAFFGGPSVAATAWVSGLEERDDGLWPRFDIEVLVRMIEAMAGQDHWTEWGRISCPTLIVRGESGSLTAEDAESMRSRMPRATVVEVRAAGHDVHLDRPDDWRQVLSLFLRTGVDVQA